MGNSICGAVKCNKGLRRSYEMWRDRKRIHLDISIGDENS